MGKERTMLTVKSPSLTAFLVLAGATAHELGLPVNPELGVPGFPDCTRLTPGKNMTVEHAAGKFAVTNLGACGSTMLKKANSPYWKRPQMKALTSAKWDILIIMLGTNDAKDPGD